MLSVVIPTHNSERLLVPTLAMLVPGVMASAVREVVVADGASTDGTREVVDFAGCTILSSPAPLGPRLREAATAARGDWLLFLRPGALLTGGWINETAQFIESTAGSDLSSQAATYRPEPGARRPRAALLEAIAVFRLALAPPRPEHGLLISRALYQMAGGHLDEANPEAGLLQRLGRRHIARLGSGIRQARADQDIS